MLWSGLSFIRLKIARKARLLYDNPLIIFKFKRLMVRTLLVKMSSMGDIIQTLPALTDALAAIPDLKVDWVAEQAFAEIPTWHAAVGNVLPIRLRAWRKHLRQSLKSGEPQAFWRQLRQVQYDAIVDAQGSLKSAVMSRIAKGARHGYTKADVREWGAHFCYQHHYAIPRATHALVRTRELMAQSLGYALPDTAPDYGIHTEQFPMPSLALPEKYVIAVTNASWESKIWPAAYWQQVINDIYATYQLPILIPCGNAQEQAFAEQVAGAHGQVLPRLRLGELAAIIGRAQAMISSDTGLAHLAAALQVKSIVLYGSTNAARIGTMGANQTHLIATTPPCAPCHKRICTYQGETPEQPACLASLTPRMVLDALAE